jgi:hypothetical protein
MALIVIEYVFWSFTISTISFGLIPDQRPDRFHQPNTQWSSPHHQFNREPDTLVRFLHGVFKEQLQLVAFAENCWSENIMRGGFCANATRTHMKFRNRQNIVTQL